MSEKLLFRARKQARPQAGASPSKTGWRSSGPTRKGAARDELELGSANSSANVALLSFESVR